MTALPDRTGRGTLTIAALLVGILLMATVMMMLIEAADREGAPSAARTQPADREPNRLPAFLRRRLAEQKPPNTMPATQPTTDPSPGAAMDGSFTESP